jgi:hypothetical protein
MGVSLSVIFAYRFWGGSDMRAPHIFLAGFLLIFCAGCAGSIGRVDRDATVDSNSDSYFVIGVKPEFTQVLIFKGWVTEAGFYQNPLLPATVSYPVEGGFIVGKTHAGAINALTKAILYSRKSDWGVGGMVHCKDSKSLVFVAPAGKVIYLTSLNYRWEVGGLIEEYRQEFSAAKAYMESHYPNLAQKLEIGKFDLMHVTTEKCEGER